MELATDKLNSQTSLRSLDFQTNPAKVEESTFFCLISIWVGQYSFFSLEYSLARQNGFQRPQRSLANKLISCQLHSLKFCLPNKDWQIEEGSTTKYSNPKYPIPKYPIPKTRSPKIPKAKIPKIETTRPIK